MTDRITANWGRAGLDRLYPQDGQPVVDEIATAVEGLTGLIDVVRGVLDIAAGLLLTPVDLISAVLEVALAAIDALIEGLLGTGLGVTWNFPTSYKTSPTVTASLNQLADSMVDEYDPDRPFGESEDNYFALWAVFGVAPSIKELLSLFSTLARLFQLPLEVNLDDSEGSYFDRFFKKSGYPPELNVDQAVLPNWHSVNLADFGVLGDFVSTLKTVRDALSRPATNAGHIRKVLEIVGRRLDTIADAAKRLTTLLGDLAAFGLLKSGLYAVQITGQGSVAQQAAAVRSASAADDFPFKGTDRLAASAYIAVHTQAATGAGLAVFKTLFALKDLEAEDLLAPEVSEGYKKLEEVQENKSGLAAGEAFRRKWGG